MRRLMLFNDDGKQKLTDAVCLCIDRLKNIEYQFLNLKNPLKYILKLFNNLNFKKTLIISSKLAMRNSKLFWESSKRFVHAPTVVYDVC